MPDRIQDKPERPEEGADVRAAAPEQAEDELMRRIEVMSDEEVDEALRKRGFNPDRVADDVRARINRVP